jgi:hypothetical protein
VVPHWPIVLALTLLSAWLLLSEPSRAKRKNPDEIAPKTTECTASNYFRGWKRKSGYATFVMACLAMAGWVRSLACEDVVKICGRPHSVLFLVSGPSGLTGILTHDVIGEYPIGPFFSTQGIDSTSPFARIDAEWKWICFGFRYGTKNEDRSLLIELMNSNLGEYR